MLLTLKPFVQNGVKSLHEYSIVRQSIPTPRSSPPSLPDRSSSVAPPRSSPERATMDPSSSSSSSRRPFSSSAVSLPPPADMSFPMTISPMSQLPPPPIHWRGAEETMRFWLEAKSEEDRRRQEEEKTRQESLRLEQRRIEYSMLRESFHAGVPPHMVPLIFASIGGASSNNNDPLFQSIPEFAAPQYAFPSGRTSSVATHHPLEQPETRRDSRTALPPNPYASAAVPPVQQQQPPQFPLSRRTSAETPPAQTFGRSSLGGPTDPRAPTISRINSVAEINTTPINVSTIAQYGPGSSSSSSIPAPAQLAKPEPQTQQQSSQSIYFHHWVPPNQSQSGTGPNPQHGESSHHQSSPGRKRKAQGAHQSAPPPSSHSSSDIQSLSVQTTTTTTTGRRRSQPTHLRQRSDASVVSSYNSRFASERPRSERSSDPSPTQAVPASVSILPGSGSGVTTSAATTRESGSEKIVVGGDGGGRGAMGEENVQRQEFGLTRTQTHTPPR